MAFRESEFLSCREERMVPHDKLQNDKARQFIAILGIDIL